MRHNLRRFAILASVIALATLTTRAQMRVVPLDDEKGHVALGLALRHLMNTGIFLQTTAHPDDENNGLLVMLNRGQGFKTALATATRGNGGQNEIGPELFEALGVLRTEELAALHRFDGADQYFTRAVDFGYSFSIEESFEKWGKDEITSDYVRLIRTIRPDVVVSLMPDGPGGGQHHQASALITHDAVKLAGDPTKYPEQIKEGLRPWQPRKFYYFTGFGPAAQQNQGRDTKINLAIYDPLLGRTYSEIGTEARSMHKCQGMAQLLGLPGPASTSYRLTECSIPGQLDREDKSLFDGVDTSVQSLAKFAGSKPPKDLTEGLSVIAGSAQNAMKAFDTQSDAATLQPLLAGLFATRVLRRELRGMNIDDAAKFEIDFRLRQKEQEFQQAILQADAIRVDVLADDGIVVPGQPLNISMTVANRGAADVTIKSVNFEGFGGAPTCELRPVVAEPFFPGRRQRQPLTGPVISVIKKDVAARCDVTATVPPGTRISEPYWHREGEAGRYTFDADAPFGLPYRPSPFYAQVTFGFPNGEEVIDGLPVQYRYEGNIFSGEKRIDPLVVPAYSIRVSPETAIVPADLLKRPTMTSTRSPAAKGHTADGAQGASGRGSDRTAGGTTGRTAGRPAATAGRRAAPARAAVPAEAAAPLAAGREIRVTVTNDTPGAVENVVHLAVPEGWMATPAEQPVKFTRSDESQTVRFEVKLAPNTAPGEYHVKATIEDQDGTTYDRGFQVIEYPHIRRRHIYHAADVALKVVDVKTTPNLTVGYVMGVGDQVPPAIEQLGARVEMLDADDLAWGDLRRFNVIVTGVRAYERRDDLRANNARLLDYVFNGGTLIVQYNKFEFNDAQYGPYAAKVSSNRVTDEHAPVQVLEPDNPIFSTPNRITDQTWAGWVQERGLYFLGEHDSRYHELVQMEDPFPLNPGVKKGALVEATYGKGKWVYVGLNLWRQLPAGTDGAYQLLANLLTLGH